MLLGHSSVTDFFSLFFFIKSISISLAQKLLSVCAQLPKCQVISILPIEECQALGHKIIDLAQQSDGLGLSLSWNEDSFFILKMAFIDPTFVRPLYLLVLGILWDIMNRSSIALSLLKKKRKKETCFSSQHNSDVACVWRVGPMSDSRVTCLRWVPVKMRALGRTGLKLFPLFSTASGSDSGRS